MASVFCMFEMYFCNFLKLFEMPWRLAVVEATLAAWCCGGSSAAAIGEAGSSLPGSLASTHRPTRDGCRGNAGGRRGAAPVGSGGSACCWLPTEPSLRTDCTALCKQMCTFSVSHCLQMCGARGDLGAARLGSPACRGGRAGSVEWRGGGGTVSPGPGLGPAPGGCN